MSFFRSKVSLGLGISFILLFCSIYISISYKTIENYLKNAYGSEYVRLYVFR